MRNAFTISLLAGLSLFAGCSGGSETDLASVRIKCIGGQSFCIISCDLGCTQTGCSVSEIAENQRLRFKFSDRVETASVNSTSISIRTATGVAPDGEYLVADNEVTFVPRVSTSNGVSTFGFLRNESYIITLLGGDSGSQGVRSIAGDSLTSEFSCTVRASLGIQDDDQQAPAVELLAPVNLTAVSLDPTIVLRFSELIDTTPLLSPLSASSPVRVVLRGTLPSGECDRDAEGIVLEGLVQLSTESIAGRDVTVVTYQPPVTLPSKSCLTVYITSDLRDLSGRAAVPRSFEMLTVEGVSVPITVTELFANSSGQETLVSGGVWSDGARPGLIGRDGLHGSFKPQLGNSVNGTFEWNIDNFTIPASNTPSGLAYTVTDGRFFFTDFIVPAGVTVRFLGSVPAQIFVRGKAEIHGTIDVSGADMPHTVPTTGPLAGLRASSFNSRTGTTNPAFPVGWTLVTNGQAGGAGGCGGGRGGNGGVESTGVTTPANAVPPLFIAGVNMNNGQDGGGVRVLASHAYAGNAGGTGGAGSPMHPTAGTAIAAGAPYIVGVSAQNFYDEFSRGGGGGGFMLAGSTAGLPTIALPTQPNPSAAAAAGLPFALLPLPVSPPLNYQSLDHFLVGGAGGGGGGSHPFGIAIILTDDYMAGHGGSGGGGAVMIRAGGDLNVSSTARFVSRGGRGVVINGDGPTPATQDVEWGISSPGGGGSGGSFLLQSGRTLAFNGLVDTTGGEGSRVFNCSTALAPTQINVAGQAGAGSSGFFRLEAPNVVWNGQPATVPAYVAGTNSATLTDRDPTSGDLSTWRGTGQVFPPVWLRYELDVDLDGNGTVDITYTDSGEPGTQKANDPNGPLTIRFQGATINQSGTAPIEGTIRAWREGIGSGAGPGIGLDSVTGFRFAIDYNRFVNPDQVVRALRVFART